MDLTVVKKALLSAELVSQEYLDTVSDRELMACDLYKDLGCDSLSFWLFWQALPEIPGVYEPHAGLFSCETVGDVLNLP